MSNKSHSCPLLRPKADVVIIGLAILVSWVWLSAHVQSCIKTSGKFLLLSRKWPIMWDVKPYYTIPCQASFLHLAVSVTKQLTWLTARQWRCAVGKETAGCGRGFVYCPQHSSIGSLLFASFKMQMSTVPPFHESGKTLLFVILM